MGDGKVKMAWKQLRPGKVTMALLVGIVLGIAASMIGYATVGAVWSARYGRAGGNDATPHALFSVETKDKLVALTFDDGPDPRFTPRILSALKKYDAGATFFCEGRNAAAYPRLIRAEIAAGHEVGNHTMNHRDMQFVSSRLARREILDAGKAIARAGGEKPIYFRPPRGHLNLESMRLANRLGCRVVLWSMGLERVKGFTLNQDADVVVANLRPGMIILAHDSSPTRWWVPKVLPRLLRRIRARGYRVVTLSELLRAESR